MRRLIPFLFPGLFAIALTAASLITTSPASAVTIGPTTTCNNGVTNAGGEGAVCEVTIVNTITPSGSSAVVTVRECTGSFGVPDTTCTNTTTPLTQAVTAVTQCEGTSSGGGGKLLCSVVVTNNFVGLSPTVTAVTVNQCVGSVTTGTVMICDPFPATTTGATITQCNGSANGGGTSLTCYAAGTQSSGLAVTITQCNGSSNGGGSVTVCSSNLRNNVLPAPSATGLPNASTRDQNASQPSGTNPLVLSGLALLAVLSLYAAFRREPLAR